MSGGEKSPSTPPAKRGGGPDQPDQLPLPLREGEGGRGWRPLCNFADLHDCGSRSFPPPAGSFTGLFAVRQGDAVFVYVNSCPHIGTPLDWVPGRFLSADGSRIICATHGAEFRITDGECLRGPCFGDRLEPVMIQIKDGIVFVPQVAGE
jgi:nitrite reductase/ring-hydroxylating ferredoxin subunit